jgi:hypothetical protein
VQCRSTRSLGVILAITELSAPARTLAQYMCELSEQAWHAGWMENLEYDLWAAVVNGPTRYGQMELSSPHLAKLRELSEACGGWIVFGEREEEFVASSAWISQFSNRRAGTAKR